MGKFAIVVFLIAAAISGCATTRSNPVPLFDPEVATLVTARVLHFKQRSAFIDFDDAFISFDAVVAEVLEPAHAAGKQVYLQYQGEPTVRGVRLREGARITFTLPFVPSNECCGPYLDKLDDLVVHADGS